MERENALDRARRPTTPPVPTLAAPPGELFAGDAPPSTTLSLSAPALLVEARFRDLTLATRLLRADQPGRFTVGPGRGADAPVNPAWLGPADLTTAHPLVERVAGAFVVTLVGSMRAQLLTLHQRLPLAPDAGRPEAPLALPADAFLRIPCGEVTFELRAVEATDPLPRPWLPRGWRNQLRYPAGVALALLALLLIAHLIPSDPRALSLDMFGADRRIDRMMTIPLDVASPVMDRVLNHAPAAPGGSAAASGTEGVTRRDPRPTVQRQATAKNAAEAAARVRTSSILGILSGAPTDALADVLGDAPAMGNEAADVLAHMQGTTVAEGYGTGFRGGGTGAGPAGTGEGIIGLGTIGTLGKFGKGHGPGTGPGGYGSTVGTLATRQPHPPDVLIGDISVRGSLDKEIIRRTVRRHLNEVRFCYEKALAAHPSIAGRVVVQFTIAPTGRVPVALLQSTTLGVASVESCMVEAVRRWEFPQPEGGGLVSVSYPFQLAPAGL